MNVGVGRLLLPQLLLSQASSVFRFACYASTNRQTVGTDQRLVLTVGTDQPADGISSRSAEFYLLSHIINVPLGEVARCTIVYFNV